jgi:L-2-hydroxyglutarate oxidase LhgO
LCRGGGRHRRPGDCQGASLAVLEKEGNVAPHQSSHNSGVIHSGVYYKPGSKQAAFCVEGRKMMLQYLKEHSIPHRICGKLVVATTEREIPLLNNLYERAKANGLEGIAMLDPAAAKKVEPFVKCLIALHVPGTGIVDYQVVARSYAEDITKAGGMVLTGTPLLSGTREGGKWHLKTPGRDLQARLIVNCAGLQCDRVALNLGVDPNGRVYPFRGEYHRLSDTAAKIVNGLVYPVPDPELPFLGVHLTPTMKGEVLAGPNALLALSREGYLKTSIVVRDLWECLSYKGFPPFIAHYARTGFNEGIRSLGTSLLLRDLQKFVPSIKAEDISWGWAGVRAELMDPSGRIEDDFVIRKGEGVMHVLNAPSPAATSSLALGQAVAKEALELG